MLLLLFNTALLNTEITVIYHSLKENSVILITKSLQGKQPQKINPCHHVYVGPVSKKFELQHDMHGSPTRTSIILSCNPPSSLSPFHLVVPLIDHSLAYPPVHLFVYPLVYLALHLLVHPQIYLPAPLIYPPSISQSIPQSVPQYIFQSISWSFTQSMCYPIHILSLSVSPISRSIFKCIL